MEVAEKKIQFLTAEDFMSDYNTTGLVLRENQIQRIDTDTFISVNSSLKSLDLSSNKIVSLNGSVRYLTALTKLYLSNNSIQVFRFINLFILKKNFVSVMLADKYLSQIFERECIILFGMRVFA